MKLVRFKSPSNSAEVAINPDHVTFVVSSRADQPQGSTYIQLGPDNSRIVDEPYDAVVSKLSS
jgi:hypothetical protein